MLQQKAAVPVQTERDGRKPVFGYGVLGRPKSQGEEGGEGREL